MDIDMVGGLLVLLVILKRRSGTTGVSRRENEMGILLNR